MDRDVDTANPTDIDTGPKYFAHVYTNSSGEVIVNTNTSLPEEFSAAIKERKVPLTYVDSILLTDRAQAVQLSALGTADMPSDAYGTVENKAKYLPHVEDAVRKFQAQGLRVVPMSFNLTVAGDPTKVVETLKQIATSPIKQPPIR